MATKPMWVAWRDGYVQGAFEDEQVARDHAAFDVKRSGCTEVRVSEEVGYIRDGVVVVVVRESA